MKRREPRQRQRRHLDRQIELVAHDPYHPQRKLPGTVVCPDCGALYRRGRWRWGAAPKRADAQLCPACRRTRERQPAGYVRLRGDFLARHREEVLRLVRNEEAREKSEHPLQRIMAIREDLKGVEVTTTDVHLARRLGGALHAAFQGDLEVKYSPDEYLVRVRWKR